MCFRECCGGPLRGRAFALLSNLLSHCWYYFSSYRRKPPLLLWAPQWCSARPGYHRYYTHLIGFTIGCWAENVYWAQKYWSLCLPTSHCQLGHILVINFWLECVDAADVLSSNVWCETSLDIVLCVKLTGLLFQMIAGMARTNFWWHVGHNKGSTAFNPRTRNASY